MAKTKTSKKIGDVPASALAGALEDLLGKISRSKGWWEKFLLFLKGQNPFAQQGDIIIPEDINPVQALKILTAYKDGTLAAFLERDVFLEKWRAFYQKFLPEIPAERLDFSNLEIPEKPEGFDRLIIVVQGLTRNQLYAKCKKKFGASKTYHDLDEQVISIRTTEKTYAIWVRDRIEADEENKGISYNASQKSPDIRIKEGITLEERLLLELIYWDETGKHLDISNWTLCSGSRYRDGYAVFVRWGVRGELYVHYYFLGYARDYLSPRSAVSLKLPEAA